LHGLQRPILTKEALDLAIEFLCRACVNGERRPPDKATLQEGDYGDEMHANTKCVSHAEDRTWRDNRGDAGEGTQAGDLEASRGSQNLPARINCSTSQESLASHMCEINLPCSHAHTCMCSPFPGTGSCVCRFLPRLLQHCEEREEAPPSGS